VQEGLTNVAKHVGSGTKADVRIHISGEYVELRITDTGRSSSASPADRDRTPHTEPGHGLVGLSERLNMLGGSLTVGPTGSGWTLAATLPTAWNTAEPVGGDTGQFAEHSR
jgi:signal transduction histidine kinase